MASKSEKQSQERSQQPDTDKRMEVAEEEPNGEISEMQTKYAEHVRNKMLEKMTQVENRKRKQIKQLEKATEKRIKQLEKMAKEKREKLKKAARKKIEAWGKKQK